MGFVFDEDMASALPAGTPTKGGEDTGYLDNYKASLKLFNLESRVSSRRDVLEKEWQPIVDKINSVTGQKLQNPATKKLSFTQASELVSQQLESPDMGRLPAGALSAQKIIEDNSKEIFEFIKKNPDLLPEFKDLTMDSIYTKANERILNAERNQQEISEKQNFAGTVGEFAGMAVGAITDPVNIAATVADITFGKGAIRGAMMAEPVIQTIAKTAFREALINAGSEAIIQTEVAKWYEDLKLPYDYTTFLANVGAAAAGGAVIGGAVAGARPLFQLTKQQMIKGTEILNNYTSKTTGRELPVDDTFTTAKESSEINDIIDSQNAVVDDAGNFEHNANVERAIEAIETSDYSKIIPEDVKLEKQTVQEFGEEDLVKYDGAESAGHQEQTDLFLSELRESINTQGDEFLDRSIPVDKFDAATGDTIQSAMTVREIVEELEQDKTMIERLTGCLT